MGTRPRWFFYISAKNWKFLGIQPSVSILSKAENHIITDWCTCRDAKQGRNVDLHMGCRHIGVPTAENKFFSRVDEDVGD